MNDIMEYIKWRGDLTFENSPFNEVDSYIIAKIGTLDLKGIVPENGDRISLVDALDIYYSSRGSRAGELGLLASKQIFPAVQAIAETERFGSLELSGYISRVNNEMTKQFSALSVILPDGRTYISFRGTDDSITGWKENFMLAVEDEVPAQKDALMYLTWCAEIYEGRLIVGGHSKGGNLAVYASAMASIDIQNRIDIIYSFDGPGFRKGFFEKSGYMEIKDRVYNILPRYSLIRTLLEQQGECRIVESGRMGPAAHDGFVWGVMGPAFICCDGLSRSSRSFNDTMDKVLDEMAVDERREFIDEFFGVIEEAGIEQLMDMTEHGLRKAIGLAGSFRKASKTRQFAGEILEQLLKAYAADIAEKSSITGKLQSVTNRGKSST